MDKYKNTKGWDLTNAELVVHLEIVLLVLRTKAVICTNCTEHTLEVHDWRKHYRLIYKKPHGLLPKWNECMAQLVEKVYGANNFN